MLVIITHDLWNTYRKQKCDEISELFLENKLLTFTLFATKLYSVKDCYCANRRH